MKNNIEVDVKVKCIETETTQAKLAEAIGTTPSDVNQKKDWIVNKYFVEMIDKLGYDIEFIYTKPPCPHTWHHHKRNCEGCGVLNLFVPIFILSITAKIVFILGQQPAY